MIVSCSSFSHVGWSNYETKLAVHFDTQSCAIFPPLVLYVMDYFELKHMFVKELTSFKTLSRVCPIKSKVQCLYIMEKGYFLFNPNHTKSNLEDSVRTHGKHRYILVEYIMEI